MGHRIWYNILETIESEGKNRVLPAMAEPVGRSKERMTPPKRRGFQRLSLIHILGMLDDCTFRFSQWDPNNTEKYIGTPEQWEEAQSVMGKILDDLGVEYSIGIDEAAFYGPKLDIQYKNVFGKEDTIVTIQVDQLLAEQFDMEYTDQNGKKVRPYIIHRTSLGCYERTLAYLIEKYAGALPMWMAPEQVRVLPITDRCMDYARTVLQELKAAGLRAEIDEMCIRDRRKAGWIKRNDMLLRNELTK